ncbi:ankyrin repeat domain-containing protein [Desulforhopalus singaporensis]|uniref:Ankyrin repeat-containing protein n=1 Tax=Desulforhopalus singaporensis TaxID=91360 RepID=A0A1H0W5T5_9BACT|nr:ankyrin repeat domain-containing protein [Desulforhopalus singaporensis]SDP86112.1 hypothetical protein SAMN05660330_04432 [Desulforhopalus singaporensis]
MKIKIIITFFQCVCLLFATPTFAVVSSAHEIYQQGLAAYEARDYNKATELFNIAKKGKLHNSAKEHINQLNQSIFLYAIKDNDIKTIKLLLNSGVNINSPILVNKEINPKKPLDYPIEYPNPKIPLEHAIEQENIEMVDFLLKNGAHVRGILGMSMERYICNRINKKINDYYWALHSKHDTYYNIREMYSNIKNLLNIIKLIDIHTRNNSTQLKTFITIVQKVYQNIIDKNWSEVYDLVRFSQRMKGVSLESFEEQMPKTEFNSYLIAERIGSEKYKDTFHAYFLIIYEKENVKLMKIVDATASQVGNQWNFINLD